MADDATRTRKSPHTILRRVRMAREAASEMLLLPEEPKHEG